MSGQKRMCDSNIPSSSSSAPPEKRREREGGEDGGPGVSATAGGSTAVETVIKLGGVSNLEEQDVKALQVKNRKLGESLDQRQVIEDELRERIERLETRQATDDASLLILNRYWNQFDDNVCLIGRRYDESGSESVETPAGDGRSLKPDTPEPDGDSNQERAKDRGTAGERKICRDVERRDGERRTLRGEDMSLVRSKRPRKRSCYLLYAYYRDANSLLFGEYRRVDFKISNPRESCRSEEKRKTFLPYISLLSCFSQPVLKCNSAVMSIYGVQIVMRLLLLHLFSYWRVSQRKQTSLTRLHFHTASELCTVLPELYLLPFLPALAGRKRERERVCVELLSRAEGVVRESSEYRCLQSQFSVLYNESVGLKSQLDETRTRLNTTRTARLRQLEHMENDEVSLQRKVRTEVFQLEDTLAQVRKEYEMLRIEFEQTLAANEQAGPINREMRHLISTLQTHNQHMKGEVVKYKLTLREAQTDLSQARTTKGSAILQSQSSTELDLKEETTSPLMPAASADVTIKMESDNGSATPTSTSTSVKTEPGTETEGEIKEEEKEKEKEKERERERERPTRGGGGTEEKEKAGTSNQLEEVVPERTFVIGGPKRKEVEQLKIVRAELKKAQESQREMKLLLDMYRSAPKEQRDKVQLMAAEKKAKSEAEELKQRLRDLEERERREGKKMADEEALRKICSVEEQINILNKKLSLAKQEEDALLSEMDVTGQAFEDMQEQNIRLMQQLREKDDANFKLMSERIKSNQIHKLLKEEKEELADQLLTLKTQVDAQLQVVRKLEEKERLLQGTIGTAERELALRTQALDMNKRKTQESTVLSEEVRSQLDQVQQRLGTVREEVIENSISKEKQSFNARRAQEDISKLRRKIEKAKKPAETVRNGDDILNEEINDYKVVWMNTLFTPGVIQDAVLTKCFHVFCFECVKTRYDTRQRKCPKCNAAFGANDFHRIYIE
ncbi:unnamed protein product [Oncorhynchus mykiss]|uniref:E3 ubiquitin protein ligase n=1 Tax=Oncorhynchus mykiss TaxID=8022 RepID=A0A060X2A9_ONCMY|nr:unnamed protein product [Oncorhynchus mykiss]